MNRRFWLPILLALIFITLIAFLISLAAARANDDSKWAFTGRKQNAALFWRGPLAGALGGPLCLLGLALVEIIRLGYVSYGGALELLALPTFVLMGTVYGTVIALGLWILALGHVYPPAIVRAILGASIPFLFVTILNLSRSGENTGIYPPTPMEAFANAVVYCTAFGALPGLAARPKSK